MTVVDFPLREPKRPRRECRPVKQYCLGFVFSPEGDACLLMKKKRSLYVGMWNGVGGANNPGEVAWSAMRRECREECGLDLDVWFHSADLVAADDSWIVNVFGARTPSIYDARTTTDEKIFIFPIPAIAALESAPHVPGLVSFTWDRIIRQAPIVTIKEQRR